MTNPRPTSDDLKRLLKEYGLKRWQAAKIMMVSAVALERYALPQSSKHRRNIPPLRWKVLCDEIAKLDAKISKLNEKEK